MPASVSAAPETRLEDGQLSNFAQAPARSAILGNTGVQVINPIVRTALGVVLSAFLGRFLGVRGFGEYSTILAFVATFNGVFNNWGLGTISLREISRDPTGRMTILASSAALQLLIAVATYSVMAVAVAAGPYPAPVRLSILLYGLSILLTPIDTLALTLQADLQLRRLVAPSLVGTVLNFVLILTVLIAHGPIVLVVAAALAAIVIQYALVTRRVLRHLDYGGSFRRYVDRAQWRLLLAEAWPLALATVAVTAFQQAPLLLLSTASLSAAGTFNAANRIPQQLLIGAIIVRTTTFPLLSAAWPRDRAKFISLLDRVTYAGIVVAIPIMIFSWGLARPLMEFLYGSGFTGSGLPFAILMLSFGLMFPGLLVGEGLIAAGMQRINLVIQGCALALLILLLAVVGRAGDATMAALATTAASSVLVVSIFVACKVTLPAFKLGTYAGRAALAVGLAAAVLLVGQHLYAPLVAVAAGATALGTLLAFDRTPLTYLLGRS